MAQEAKLQWWHIDEIRERKIMPVMLASPARVRRMPPPHPHQGISVTLRHSGAGMDVLKWHASTGFSDVPASVLDRLASDFHTDVSADNDDACYDAEEAQRWMLTMTTDPTLDV